MFTCAAMFLNIQSFQRVREALEEQYTINEIFELEGLYFSRIKTYFIDCENSKKAEHEIKVQQYNGDRRSETLKVVNAMTITNKQCNEG